MIDTMIFDFYGTLARATTWGAHPEEILTSRGYTYNDDAWTAFLSGHDGSEHLEASASREQYDEWRRTRLLAMLAESDVHPGEAIEIVDHLRQRVLDRVLEPYAEVVDVLTSLRDAGRQIVICSNWDWDLTEAVEETGLDKLVDVTVSSAWVGARKPHPRIFSATLTEAQADPARSIFIGDTWGPDVEGPLVAGMRPVYLQRNGHWPDPSAPADITDVAAASGVVLAADLTPLLDLR